MFQKYWNFLNIWAYLACWAGILARGFLKSILVKSNFIPHIRYLIVFCCSYLIKHASCWDSNSKLQQMEVAIFVTINS